MQHRIFSPFLRFEPIDGQTLEQLAFSIEIGFHRRDEHTFAETTRTAQKEILSGINKIMDIHGLIDV